jgi:hypothetical protein
MIAQMTIIHGFLYNDRKAIFKLLKGNKND